MAIELVDWWYDGQQRRFLEQFVRAFSGYHYRPGIRNGVQSSPVLVPCRMAYRDRMVANIQKNLSENTVLTVPLITISQTGMEGRRDAVQNPSHIDTLQVTERMIDSTTGRYTGSKGNMYTVQRLMPLPFLMKIQVDVWTSNLDQKHQLGEQMLCNVYPTFDIQNSENGIDWTALTTASLTDINWSSISIPVGNESEIDVMTFSFDLPMWISPPAKVQSRRVIREIITSVYDSDETPDGLVATDLLTRIIVTPGNYHTLVEGNEITLLNSKAGEFLENGALPSWEETIKLYGMLEPTVSKIRFTIDGKVENGQFVTGTIQLDPDNVNKLIWNIDVDTLPGNTLTAINGIIDPMKSYPGVPNGTFPNPVSGDRYLIFGDISPSVVWGSLTAKANDIIQYNGTSWSVVFTAATTTAQQHVLNLHTGNQLRWTGEEWDMGIDGIYGPGFWHLDL